MYSTFVCMCVCACRKSTGVLLARMSPGDEADCEGLILRCATPTPTTPPPVPNYKAARLIFVQGSQALFLASTETSTAGLTVALQSLCPLIPTN